MTQMTEVIEHSSTYAIKWGFWGTAAGLVIAIIGILFVRAKKESGDSKGSVEENNAGLSYTLVALSRSSASSCLGTELGR